jgi:hypothetical protein
MPVFRRKVGQEVYVNGGELRVVVADLSSHLATIRIFDRDSCGVSLCLRVGAELILVVKGQYAGELVIRKVGLSSVRLGFQGPATFDREEVHHLKNQTRWRPADGGESTQGSVRGEGACEPDNGTLRSSSEAGAAIPGRQ